MSEQHPQDRRELEFSASFRIGRGDDCEVCVKNEYVSREHVVVAFENGQWWVRDLRSANGVFVNGQRVQCVPVAGSLAIRLGIEGPFVELTDAPIPPAPPVAPAAQNLDLARYIEHYFGKSDSGQPAGEHTIMLRRAFEQVQTRQRSKYVWLLAALAVCLLAAGGYALFLHQQMEKQRASAQDLFYAMKSLDVDIANVEKLVLESGNPKANAEVRRYRDRRQEIKENYDRFLATLKVYTARMSEQDRLIYRITRVFGECEVAMPPGFTAEVATYIKKWQSIGSVGEGAPHRKEQWIHGQDRAGTARAGSPAPVLLSRPAGE